MVKLETVYGNPSELDNALDSIHIDFSEWYECMICGTNFTHGESVEWNPYEEPGSE